VQQDKRALLEQQVHKERQSMLLAQLQTLAHFQQLARQTTHTSSPQMVTFTFGMDLLGQALDKSLVLKEMQALKEILAQQVTLEILAQRVQQVRVKLAPLEILAQQDLQVRLV